MNGSRELAKRLSDTFNAPFGEISPDGKFTFSKVECLGSCGTAPMMQVNDDYYEGLTFDKAELILRELK